MGVNIRSSRLLTSHRYPAAPCDPVLDKQEQKKDGWMFAVVFAKREHDAAVNHRGRARQVRAPFFSSALSIITEQSHIAALPDLPHFIWCLFITLGSDGSFSSIKILTCIFVTKYFERWVCSWAKWFMQMLLEELCKYYHCESESKERGNRCAWIKQRGWHTEI